MLMGLKRLKDKEQTLAKYNFFTQKWVMSAMCDDLVNYMRLVLGVLTNWKKLLKVINYTKILRKLYLFTKWN